MIVKYLHQWLVKIALNQPWASRIEQNYSQLMGISPNDYVHEWLIEHILEKLRLMSTLSIKSPRSWEIKSAPYLTPAVQQWLDNSQLYQQRTLLPLLRWTGLPLILNQIKLHAPENFQLKIITTDELYHSFNSHSSSFFSEQPMAVVVFMDERLPISFRQPIKFNKNRFFVTACPAKVLSRLNLSIATLLPVKCCLEPLFSVTGSRYQSDQYQLAVNDTFKHLESSPAPWGKWDDISVLLHG